MASLIFAILYFFTLVTILIVTQMWFWKREILHRIKNAILDFFDGCLLFIYWFGDIIFQYQLFKCCKKNGAIFEKYNLVSVIAIYLFPIEIVLLIYELYSRSVPVLFGWMSFTVIWAIGFVFFISFSEKMYKKSELYENDFQNKKFSENKPHHGVAFVQYHNMREQFFISDSRYFR